MQSHEDCSFAVIVVVVYSDVYCRRCASIRLHLHNVLNFRIYWLPNETENKQSDIYGQSAGCSFSIQIHSHQPAAESGTSLCSLDVAGPGFHVVECDGSVEKLWNTGRINRHTA